MKKKTNLEILMELKDEKDFYDTLVEFEKFIPKDVEKMKEILRKSF